MKVYLYDFARPNGSIAHYRISASDRYDAMKSAERVRKLLEKYWRKNMSKEEYNKKLAE